jgi:Flp pilus assembly protein CpaB
MARPSLGGILATRQGALLLAILCAVSAAGILLFALSSYKQNVQTAKVTPQATVLVATGAIPKGTTGDEVASEKLYKSTPIVAGQLSAGAISNATQLDGTVAQADILPGAQLTQADFTTTLSAAALLAPNQRAISIQPDEIHGDLDVLAPGDHVDIYAEFDGSSGTTVSLLDPNTLVLKTPGSGLAGAPATVPAAAGAGAAAGKANAALVLQVTASLAPDIALTADLGKLWLTLRPANATSTPGGVTTQGDVIGLASSSANLNDNNSTKTGKH